MSAGWFERAACRGHDTNLFFPERGVNADEAKRVCAACPVIEECRDYALNALPHIWHGVWGGLSIDQLRKERRNRTRRAKRDRDRASATDRYVLPVAFTGRGRANA